MRRTIIAAGDGVSLAYRAAGDGPPVVLLHGFSQWSQMWIDNGVAARLAADHAVLLPDRRGHGLSGRPARPQDYGLRMVGDVFDVLDAEGHRAAHLVGFSQGAEIAWRAALDRPDRTLSVYLIGSGWPGPDLQAALGAYREILDWLPEPIAEGADWLTPDPDLATLRAIVASMPAVIDVPEAAMARLAVPASGLAGADDPEKEALLRLRDLLPRFTLEILPGTDHGGTWRHPTLPDRIHRFLTQAPAPRPRPRPWPRP